MKPDVAAALEALSHLDTDTTRVRARSMPRIRAKCGCKRGCSMCEQAGARWRWRRDYSRNTNCPRGFMAAIAKPRLCFISRPRQSIWTARRVFAGSPGPERSHPLALSPMDGSRATSTLKKWAGAKRILPLLKKARAPRGSWLASHRSLHQIEAQEISGFALVLRNQSHDQSA